MTDLSQARIASLRSKVSPEEWETRIDLAACYRLIAHYGMSDLVYNHVSARVPGEEGHFLINAYGMLYEEMSASSLVKIDFEGRVVLDCGSGYGINQAGFVIHGAVHKGRPDVGCVIHTHSIAGMAVSALDCGLLPITQTAMYFDGVGLHEYESVAI
ncbi:MAG: class II aldolase/adducin family protein, partial [Vicinamibacterales bacterium]